DILGGAGIDTTAYQGANDTLVLTFDSTELNNLTWGTGGAASITWSTSLSGANDPSIAFGDNQITFGTSATISATSTTALNLGAATVDFNGTGTIQYADGSVFTITDDSANAILTTDASNNLTLGDSSATLTLQSSDWGIDDTGDMTGIGSITADGTITFSGVGAGTDQSVVVISDAGVLSHDEIDPNVWGTDLVTATGTTNYIPYFSGADTLADSVMYQSGTSIGIGTTDPAYELEVAGDIGVTSGNDFFVGTVGLNDNTTANSGASLIGLYDDAMTNIAANTTVQGAIKELDTAINGLDNYQYWTVAGDTGSSQVDSTNQLDILGGAGIDTTAYQGANDTLVLTFDSTELNNLTWGTGGA
ncbi:MAG: hypothetical protein P8Y03_31010, partial [Anaerolineales bacterium]